MKSHRMYFSDFFSQIGQILSNQKWIKIIDFILYTYKLSWRNTRLSIVLDENMVDAETAKLVQNLKDRLKTFDEDLDRVKKAAQKIHHDLNYVKADEHEEEPIYENFNISRISRPNPVSNSFVHGRHEVVHGHDSGDGGPGGAQRFQMTKNRQK